MAQSSLPEPRDLSHHLSKSTKARQASSIKQFYKYFSIPGIGQLAGGLPNTNYFPYDTLEAKVALPDRFTPTPNKPVDPPSYKSKKDVSPPETRVLVPKTANTPNPLRKIDLASALQYGTAQGYPPLYQFLTEFTREHLHPNVPYKGGPEIILTVGNTDGFSKCIQAFSNEWHEGEDPVEQREGLLCEEYAYMNAIQQARPKGLNIVAVGIDDQGMRAEGKGGLRDVLANWDFSKGMMPHLMYTVTIGQNPTGGVLGVQRRKDIYELCVKYDILICEDDPYWYLQYPLNRSAEHVVPQGMKSSGFPFLDSLVPSYLSVDYEGRVIRMDTFSKTVAPGCRLGWITAQPRFIERILRITETSTQQPSGFVQAMIAELIMGPAEGDNSGSKGGAKDGKGWQFQGWVRWLEGLRGEYQRRMEEMCSILSNGKTIMKSGRRGSLATLTADLALETEDEWSVIEKTPVYDFVRPLGGMFLWVRFNFSTHPCFSKVEGPRLARALWLYWTQAPYRVLVSPGTIFAPTQEVLERDAWECFRLCFAAVDADRIGDISHRFVKGVKAFWRIKDKKEIDELLKEIEEGEGAGNMALKNVDQGMGSLTGFC